MENEVLETEVVEETGLSGVKVIAVGEHDTASAFCGCPLEDENAAALSCGTWSLLGMEVDEPVLTEDAFKYNYTNEGGVEGKIRLLKNINGLWVMQNLRRNWCEFEYEVGFPDIIKASREAARQDFIIDPNDPRFTAPYNRCSRTKRSRYKSSRPSRRSGVDTRRTCGKRNYNHNKHRTC